MSIRALSGVVALVAAAGAAFGQASVSLHTLTAGGNVDLPITLNQGQVAAWMTTPLGNLGTNFATPDTMLRLLNSGGGTIHTNDDAGADGRGAGAVTPVRGSLLRYGTRTGGNFTIRTLGFSASDAGLYALTQVILTPGTAGDFVDTESNNSIADAQLLSVGVGSAIYGYGNLTAGDLDYYAVNLNAGDILTAYTIPLSNLAAGNFGAVDTRLDIRNAANGIIITNDDAGGDAFDTGPVSPVRGSGVRYENTTGGLTYLTVRGFGTADVGDYALVISVIPTPGAAALLLLGLPLAARRRRS